LLAIRVPNKGGAAWKAGKMNKKPISFREQMKLARPDVVERQKRNRCKSDIAMNLRALRDAMGMTQADVANATGMSNHLIAQLEALAGSIPDIKDLQLYVDVCGGDINAVISSTDDDRFVNKSDTTSTD
jgi:ATP-dependent protease ClpP protease subunit